MARTNKYTEKRKREKGIVSKYGQWLYPGQVTTIPDNMITMKGVPYPVLGVSDKGDAKMMMPDNDYVFKGKEVTEYPVMQQGGFGRKRVEKNGMEYLKDTDGYTGVVQKQTQHGLGLSRRYDAPVYQYYDNGKPVGETWNGAGKFQEEISKDYESEPTIPYNRKFSSYDPNSLTYFKDLSTGETPFKPYISPETQALLDYRLPITENPSQTHMGYSAPRYIPSVNTTHYIENTNGIVNGWYNDNRENAKIEDYIDELRPWMEKYEGRRNNAYKLDGENWYTIGIGHAHVPQGTMWNDDEINETFKNDILSRANAIDRYYKEKGVTLSPRTLAGLAAYSFSGYGSNVMQRSPKLTGHIVNNRFDNIREEMDWGERKHPRLKDKHDELYKWLTEGSFQTGGKIHIKEKNRGKFTEAAQRAGKSVQAYAAQILANKGNYSPAMVKRANFARNAAKWKHQEGGIEKYLEGNYLQPKTVDNVMGAWNRNLAEVTSDADEKARWAGMILGAAGDVGVALGTKFGKDFTKPIMAGQKNKNSAAVPVTIPEFNLDEDLLKTSQENEAAEYIEEKPSWYVSPETRQKVEMATNPISTYGFVKNLVPNINNYDFGNIEGNQPRNINPINPFNMLPGSHSPNTINTSGYKEWYRQQQGHKPYYATGGDVANNVIELERGEIIQYENGDEVIANGDATYHEQFSDKNEKNGTRVLLTGNAKIDAMRNPALTFVPRRKNKYSIARHGGRKYIYPATTQMANENEFGVPGLAEPKDGLYYPLAAKINKSNV